MVTTTITMDITIRGASQVRSGEEGEQGPPGVALRGVPGSVGAPEVLAGSAVLADDDDEHTQPMQKFQILSSFLCGFRTSRNFYKSFI